MKRFKIGFSLLMSIVMIFGVLQYGLTAKRTPVKAAADITTSNYKTWTAPTLAEARDSVNKFLTPLKGSDASRPYKENRTWQEGSLAALDKVYYATVSTEIGVSSELARQQLIQTVRGLELYDSGTYSARNIALNDYPDDQLEYNLAQIMGDIESGYVPNAFVSTAQLTDYVGTMSTSIGNMTASQLTGNGALSYVKDSLVLGQYEAMRMAGLPYQGMNVQSFYRGYTYGGYLQIQDQGRTTTNFNGPSAAAGSSDLATWFGMTNPMGDRYQSSYGSDLASYVKHLTGLFDGTTNHGAYSYGAKGYVRPTIIIYSNYEFSSAAQKQAFLESLDDFEDSAGIRSRTNLSPVFIQVSFKRDNAPNYDPMVEEIFTPARVAKGWRHIEVNSTNAHDPDTLTKRILDLNVSPTRVIGGALDYKGIGLLGSRTFYPWTELSTAVSWNTTLATNQFNFVPDTFGGQYALEDSMTTTELKFHGATSGGMSTFDVTAANNNYISYEMGDKVPVYNAASITVNSAPGTYNASPNLYAPISDAAVELYTYNGTGSEAVASNYTLKEGNTIVSNTYENYGGTAYSLKSSQLASKKYGTVLSQLDLKNAVKDAMGDAAYGALDFTNSDALNAASLTVSFDASKNVYKLYAKEAPTQSTITVEHWIKNGGKISSQPDKPLTGDIGKLANITPTAINGYTYVDSDSEPLAGMTFGSTNKTVKLFYTENPKVSKMKVHYKLSSNGTDIIPPVEIEGTNGASPTTAQLDAGVVGEGYQFVFQNPTTPVFGTDTDVYLFYSIKNGKIKIEYWDKSENQLISGQATEERTGQVGTSPDPAITPKTISGYTYDSSSINLSTIKYTDAEQTVKLYYTRNKSTVNVRYVDEDTLTEIQTTKELVGPVGTKPTIEKTTFTDYTFTKSDPTDLTTVEFTENVVKTVTLYYKKVPKNITLTIKFVDEGGDDLKGSITKTQLSGEELDIAAIPDVAKVIEDLQKSYVLTESPANPYKVPQTDATVYFKFKGALKLVSVPDMLDFGIHNTQIFGEVEASKPDYDPQTPLVVSDTRAPIAGWTLYAKVTKEMTALDDTSDVLTDSLYYKMDNQEKPLGLNLSKSIYKPTTLKTGQYNISQLEWENKNNGFIFRLPREQRRSMKDYQAVIEYTLSDAY
ncbi:MucBP domain-containing protein [Enterococcus sp. AZ192]